jgi:hypothetical protein
MTPMRCSPQSLLVSTTHGEADIRDRFKRSKGRPKGLEHARLLSADYTAMTPPTTLARALSMLDLINIIATETLAEVEDEKPA